ncbi:vesicle-trafficking protein SEC22b-like [Hylaeus volcanicus]|uniref:vesicle-trafficking protein SEC22b-like n=1 Tax=Hylaeus volcanicus TaxID=313075 RepID=UPI0023B79E4D|nr:vesicle-trafficking protein SEC22b-like [Hylaeus volcanicus]
MKVAYVARKSDGLILCQSWDTQNVAKTYNQQGKEILKSLGRSETPTRCTIDTTNNMCFHYMVQDKIVYMVLTKLSFSKKAVFVFLEEMATAFQQELQITFGTRSLEYNSLIETIEKAYYFIHFDRTIQHLMKTFENPQSHKAFQKLNESLIEVTTIMRQNVDTILERGENLESVGKKANDLKLTSSKFSRSAKYINLKTLIEKLIFFSLFVLLIVVLIYAKLNW